VTAKRIRLWRRRHRRIGGAATGRYLPGTSFEQGNKRTSFVAMTEFLMIDGYELAIEDSLPWADAIIELVEHRSTENDFVRLIRPFVIPVG
jgi:hypothetical protein